MKKIDTSSIGATTGMPVKSGSIEHLQNSYREQMVALFQGFITNYDNTKVNILFGVQNTNTAPIFDITKGYVSFNDELFEVDAVTFTAAATAVAVIVTTNFSAANADPVMFTDGVGRNVHQIRKVAIIDGSGASTGYIADFADFIQPIYRGSDLMVQDSIANFAVNSTSYQIVNGTFVPSTTLGGTVTFMLDLQLNPNSGGGGTNYAIDIKIRVNGSDLSVKTVSLVNDGSFHSFSLIAIGNYPKGTQVDVMAKVSTAATCDVNGHLVVFGTRLS